MRLESRARTLIIWKYFVRVCADFKSIYDIWWYSTQEEHCMNKSTRLHILPIIILCIVCNHLTYNKRSISTYCFPSFFLPTRYIYIYILKIRATLVTKSICLHISTETFAKVHFHVKHNDMQNRCHWEAGTLCTLTLVPGRYISTITTLLEVWAKSQNPSQYLEEMLAILWLKFYTTTILFTFVIQSRLRLVCVVYTWDLSTVSLEVFLVLLVLHFFFSKLKKKNWIIDCTIDHGFQT